MKTCSLIIHYYSSIQAVNDHDGNPIGSDVCILQLHSCFCLQNIFLERQNYHQNSNYMNITQRNMAKLLQTQRETGKCLFSKIKPNRSVAFSSNAYVDN